MSKIKIKRYQTKTRKRLYCPLCFSNPNNTEILFTYSKEQFSIQIKCYQCNLETSIPISMNVLKAIQFNFELKKIDTNINYLIEQQKETKEVKNK